MCVRMKNVVMSPENVISDLAPFLIELLFQARQRLYQSCKALFLMKILCVCFSAANCSALSLTWTNYPMQRLCNLLALSVENQAFQKFLRA